MTLRTGSKSKKYYVVIKHVNALIMEMGKGNEKVREDGIPGITNYIFSETAARGMYRRWADLLIHEKWEDVEKAADEYEKELMK